MKNLILSLLILSFILPQGAWGKNQCALLEGTDSLNDQSTMRSRKESLETAREIHLRDKIMLMRALDLSSKATDITAKEVGTDIRRFVRDATNDQRKGQIAGEVGYVAATVVLDPLNLLLPGVGKAGKAIGTLEKVAATVITSASQVERKAASQVTKVPSKLEALNLEIGKRLTSELKIPAVNDNKVSGKIGKEIGKQKVSQNPALAAKPEPVTPKPQPVSELRSDFGSNSSVRGEKKIITFNAANKNTFGAVKPKPTASNAAPQTQNLAEPPLKLGKQEIELPDIPKAQEMKTMRGKDGKIKGVKGTQEHHIVSNKNRHTKDHELWDLAGMNPNNRSNRMLLPDKTGKKLTTTDRSLHEGRHFDSLSKDHAEEMRQIVRQGKVEGWSQEKYAEKLKKFLFEQRISLKEGKIILNNAKVE